MIRLLGALIVTLMRKQCPSISLLLLGVSEVPNRGKCPSVVIMVPTRKISGASPMLGPCRVLVPWKVLTLATLVCLNRAMRGTTI